MTNARAMTITKQNGLSWPGEIKGTGTAGACLEWAVKDHEPKQLSHGQMERRHQLARRRRPWLHRLRYGQILG